jgi:carbonic anhydrase
LLLNEILDFNKQFVENKEYEKYQTGSLPRKKLVILSCMDTRLLELLPKSMNLRNGDIKIIKNAGAIITSSHGSVIKSILVAIYALKAEEVMVIGHHNCGMGKIDPTEMQELMKERGITEEDFKAFEEQDKVDLNDWLRGFKKVEDSVQNSVNILRSHPLLPKDTPVHGLVIDPETGKLDLVESGYNL